MTYVYTVLSACHVYVIQKIPGEAPCDAYMRFTMCVTTVLPGDLLLAVLSEGIHCKIQSLLCVEHFWKFHFNGSGVVGTLHFVLRVIHLVTRVCGSQGVSQAYPCGALCAN